MKEDPEESTLSALKKLPILKRIFFTDFANEELKVNTNFVGWFSGFAQSLDIDDGYITNDLFSTMAISLNNSLSYQINIIDSKIQILRNSNSFPITRISLMNEFVGALQVYLKVNTCIIVRR